MKRLFYLLFGLVLLPALLYAQGSLSLKDINDNLTNNYYTKTVSDGKYAMAVDVSAKADKTYVDANFATTAENSLKQNIADMVDYYTKTAVDLLLADKADTDSVYTKTAADILLGLKANLTYVNDTDENIINTLIPAKADLIYVNATDEATIAALNTQISRYNITNSSGALMQPTIADDGSGGVIISPFSYAIKTADSDTAELAYFMSDTVEIASGDLADNSMNWIYADYNSGTPTFNDTTSYSNIRHTDQFLVGFLYKSGTSLTIVSHGTEISNFVSREEARLYARGIVERMSGAVIGEKATRYVTMTEGLFYTGISRVERAAKDSKTDGFAAYWSYNSGTSTWTNNVATYPNQIENTLYNKISDGSLATLTNNRYGVHWIYICGSGNLHVIFGQGNYSLANAQAAQPPSVLPACLADMGLLLGRIIVLKGASTFLEVDSAFNVQFSPSGVTNHNDLANRDEASSHPATAVSATWTNVQVSLDSIEAAIQGIVIGSGFATETWVNSTLETNFFTQAQTNATIEAAIAAMPTADGNITISVDAAETLAPGDVVSLLNTNNVITAKKTDNTNVAGVCQNACDTDEVASILVKGTDSNQSGLVAGALYYRQVDYSIGTQAVSISGNYIFVGYGKSATELVLD